MRTVATILFAALLLGCARHVSPAVPPTPAPSPDPPAPVVVCDGCQLVDHYFEEAKAQLLARFPDAVITDPRPILEVVWMPTDGLNPETGNPGFLASRVGAPEPDEFCKATAGHSCHGLLQGWTPIPPDGGLFKSYDLAEVPQVLAHEFGHILYFLWRPAEQCPNGMIGFSWKYIGHRGPCDPMER